MSQSLLNTDKKSLVYSNQKLEFNRTGNFQRTGNLIQSQRFSAQSPKMRSLSSQLMHIKRQQIERNLNNYIQKRENQKIQNPYLYVENVQEYNHFLNLIKEGSIQSSKYQEMQNSRNFDTDYNYSQNYIESDSNSNRELDPYKKYQKEQDDLRWAEIQAQQKKYDEMQQNQQHQNDQNEIDDEYKEENKNQDEYVKKQKQENQVVENKYQSYQFVDQENQIEKQQENQLQDINYQQQGEDQHLNQDIQEELQSNSNEEDLLIQKNDKQGEDQDDTFQISESKESGLNFLSKLQFSQKYQIQQHDSDKIFENNLSEKSQNNQEKQESFQNMGNQNYEFIENINQNPDQQINEIENQNENQKDSDNNIIQEQIQENYQTNQSNLEKSIHSSQLQQSQKEISLQEKKTFYSQSLHNIQNQNNFQQEKQQTINEIGNNNYINEQQQQPQQQKQYKQEQYQQFVLNQGNQNLGSLQDIDQELMEEDLEFRKLMENIKKGSEQQQQLSQLINQQNQSQIERENQIGSKLKFMQLFVEGPEDLQKSQNQIKFQQNNQQKNFDNSFNSQSQKILDSQVKIENLNHNQTKKNSSQQETNENEFLKQSNQGYLQQIDNFDSESKFICENKGQQNNSNKSQIEIQNQSQSQIKILNQSQSQNFYKHNEEKDKIIFKDKLEQFGKKFLDSKKENVSTLMEIRDPEVQKYSQIFSKSFTNLNQNQNYIDQNNNQNDVNDMEQQILQIKISGKLQQNLVLELENFQKSEIFKQIVQKKFLVLVQNYLKKCIILENQENIKKMKQMGLIWQKLQFQNQYKDQMVFDCFYAWKERIEKKRKKEINKMKLKEHLKKKNGKLIQKCFYLFCKYAIQHAKWVQAVQLQMEYQKKTNIIKAWKYYIYKKKIDNQVYLYYLGILFNNFKNGIKIQQKQEKYKALSFQYNWILRKYFGHIKYFKKMQQKKNYKIKRFVQQRKNELLQKAFNNWIQFKNESKDNEYIEIQVNIKEKVLIMKDEQQEEQSQNQLQGYSSLKINQNSRFNNYYKSSMFQSPAKKNYNSNNQNDEDQKQQQSFRESENTNYKNSASYVSQEKQSSNNQFYNSYQNGVKSIKTYEIKMLEHNQNE